MFSPGMQKLNIELFWVLVNCKPVIVCILPKWANYKGAIEGLKAHVLSESCILNVSIF